MLKKSLALFCSVAIAASVQAQDHAGMDHSKHMMAAPAGSVMNQSTHAYMQANDAMHKNMSIQFTGDADYDFLAGMIPHHQGAIDMAEVVLKHGKDWRVLPLARNIIWDQKKEIRQMQYWLPRLPKSDASTAKNESTAAYEAVNTRMHEGMNIRFTGDADYDFVAGMIPHHQGAIDMAEVVLQYGKNRQVKQIARDIIAAQRVEIWQMQAWMRQMEEANPALKNRAPAPAPAPAPTQTDAAPAPAASSAAPAHQHH